MFNPFRVEIRDTITTGFACGYEYSSPSGLGIHGRYSKSFRLPGALFRSSDLLGVYDDI